MSLTVCVASILACVLVSCATPPAHPPPGQSIVANRDSDPVTLTIELDNHYEQVLTKSTDGELWPRIVSQLEANSDEARTTLINLEKEIVSALTDSLHRRNVETADSQLADKTTDFVLEFRYSRMGIPLPGTTWVEWSAVFENRKTGEVFFMLNDRRTNCGYGRSDRPLWQVFRDCASRQIAIELADAIDEALKNRR